MAEVDLQAGNDSRYRIHSFAIKGDLAGSRGLNGRRARGNGSPGAD